MTGHSRIFLALASVAVALGASAPALAAQRLRGQVLLPDSATPARGVIVVATGDNGAPMRRALTNARGSFELMLPRAGRFSVQVLRIGFRPTVAETVELAADETRSLRIVVGGDRIALAKVTVRGQDVCRSEPESGLLVARVWEEARKALMASQLVADRPLVAEWIEFDRTLDPGGTRVREQRVRTTRSPTTHAFRSRPADSLAAEGYIVADIAATTFYAPDADVLLSESFASLHCFHVEPPPAGRADLIGVGFSPARGQRDAKDIEGTLWLVRESAELEWLEYRYTNVPAAAERAGAGGRVEFLRLASGEWFVSRWNIRMPRLGAPERIPTDGTRRIILAGPDAALKSVQITGGEVTSVSRGDSLLFRAAGAGFTVQVMSRDSLVPVAGASVSLVGTDYAATADAAGRARIAPVLAGRYRARLRSVLMDTLGASAVERDVEIREGVAHIDSLLLPAVSELLRAACGGEVARRNESLLRGTVRDSLGRAAAQAAVTITFQTDVGKVNMQKGDDRMFWSEQTLGALTNDSGYWRLCGVPREKVIAVRVTTDEGADERRIRLAEDQAFATTDLVLLQSAAALDIAMAAKSGALTGTTSALVEISVSTRSGAPLPDATVELVPRSGPSRTVRTLESGHALVPAVDPGLIRVRARRIGFKAGELAVLVEAGRNTVPIILDEARLPSLDTVRVMGSKRVLTRHDEFETRRLRGDATASITAEEIQKRNPAQTWQVLTNVPSIKVTERFENGNFVVVASSDRGMISDFGNVPCFLRVMVDGVMMPADDAAGRPNLSFLPPPSSIHGIEVFAGGASIPLQYTGAGAGKWCGLIAIWTK